QDLLDLQVWYNLTWIGPYSREREPIAQLMRKGSGFSEDEKQALLESARGIIREIIPAHRRLMESGQIEISTTPYYHPILPLLCDQSIASESAPGTQLPTRRAALSDDAREQIQRGLQMFEDHIGIRPGGMWPSEGSVSSDACELIAAAGMRWTATDE